MTCPSWASQGFSCPACNLRFQTQSSYLPPNSRDPWTDCHGHSMFPDISPPSWECGPLPRWGGPWRRVRGTGGQQQDTDGWGQQSRCPSRDRRQNECLMQPGASGAPDTQHPNKGSKPKCLRNSTGGNSGRGLREGGGIFSKTAFFGNAHTFWQVCLVDG